MKAQKFPTLNLGPPGPLIFKFISHTKVYPLANARGHSCYHNELYQHQRLVCCVRDLSRICRTFTRISSTSTVPKIRVDSALISGVTRRLTME